MCEEDNLSATLPNYAIEKLHEIAKREGFISYKIELPNSGFGRGSSFISDVVRVKLVDIKSTSTQKELKLICKLMPPSEIRRKVFSSIKLFEREVFMYEKIIPIFRKFQLDHGLFEINGFFNVAKCFGCICEPESNKFLIILEDLGVKKFDTWSPKNQQIPPEHVRLLMKTLGKFHGISFAIRDQQPEYLKEFQKLDSSWLYAVNEPLYVRNINLLIGQANSEVETFSTDNSDQDVTEQLNVLRNLKENWKQMWQQGLSNGVAEPFSVVLHGDFWNSNILFANDKVESLDDHAGRILVKMALGSTKEWFNEFMIQPISKAEYTQYAKVINSAKYEEYKIKQEQLNQLKIKQEKESNDYYDNEPRNSEHYRKNNEKLTTNQSNREHDNRNDRDRIKKERSSISPSSLSGTHRSRRSRSFDKQSIKKYTNDHREESRSTSKYDGQNKNSGATSSRSNKTEDDRRDTYSTKKSTSSKNDRRKKYSSDDDDSSDSSSSDDEGDRGGGGGGGEKGSSSSSRHRHHHKSKSKKKSSSLSLKKKSSSHSRKHSSSKSSRRRQDSDDDDYQSGGGSNSEDDRHFKKKTKKSKRPRSRSRSRHRR